MGHRDKGARLHVVALSLGVVVLATLLAACATGGVGPVAVQCPTPPPCGEHCSNQPFVPTDCWTTDYGPAKADVVLSSHNFLFCAGGSYALCFFSCPPTATGDNRSLPCVLNGDVANCTCQVYTSGPYFIDINSILNLGAYYETVQACTADGSDCANLHYCGSEGTAEECQRYQPAPVCRYVRNQKSDDPGVSLIPNADVVSAFSFAMHADYKVGKTKCETPPKAGFYAGCMTAPCFFPSGATIPPSDGDPVQCQCPVFSGPYQVGQDGQTCKIPPSDGTIYVWSASYTVPRRDK